MFHSKFFECRQHTARDLERLMRTSQVTARMGFQARRYPLEQRVAMLLADAECFLGGGEHLCKVTPKQPIKSQP